MLVFVPAFGGVDESKVSVPSPVGVCGRKSVIFVVTIFNPSVVNNTRLYF